MRALQPEMKNIAFISDSLYMSHMVFSKVEKTVRQHYPRPEALYGSHKENSTWNNCSTQSAATTKVPTVVFLLAQAATDAQSQFPCRQYRQNTYRLLPTPPLSR